jgi:hypothetical protein
MPKVQKPRLSAAKSAGSNRKNTKEGRRTVAAKAPRQQKETTARQSTESNTGAESTEIGDEITEIGNESLITGSESSGISVRQSSQTTKKPYTYLTAQTRRIPQDIVASEWVALPLPARQRFKDVLTTAKRAVVSCTRSQKRNAEAEAVIGALMDSLSNRLPRMPFPPNSKELNFDLEKLLERSVSTSTSLISVAFG